MSRPPSGSMVYWRFRAQVPCNWRFGYVSYVKSWELIRMGNWNGDTSSGPIVSVSEIEWRKHS